ncbi:MAG: hypothetical protein AB1515_06970 [Nitrospirota bacterium]
MLVLIEANENCAEGGSWRFNALEPPRPVARVRLYDRSAQGEWFQVVGWTGRPERPTSPAVAQKIDDSGQGVAYLVTGGDQGLRLKPAGSAEPWSVDNPRQWGAPYLIVASPRDLADAEKGEEK